MGSNNKMSNNFVDACLDGEFRGLESQIELKANQMIDSANINRAKLNGKTNSI